MYITQVSSTRKASAKNEKPLCIFEKVPVPSFTFTAHCFQVCIAKMLLLFPAILYFLFWAEGSVLSARIYLSLICPSTSTNSITCITRIPYSSCCCYLYTTFVTKVKCHYLWFAGEEQRPREKGIMHQMYNAPRCWHTQSGLWQWGVRCGAARVGFAMLF